MEKQFKPENVEILKGFVKQWQMLQLTGEAGYIEMKDQKRLAQVYHEELDPKAILSLGCGSCVTDWFKVLYINFEKAHGEQPSVLPTNTTINPNGEEKSIAKAVESKVPFENKPGRKRK